MLVSGHAYHVIGSVAIEMVKCLGQLCEVKHVPIIKVTPGGDAVDWHIDLMNHV